MTKGKLVHHKGNSTVHLNIPAMFRKASKIDEDIIRPAGIRATAGETDVLNTAAPSATTYKKKLKRKMPKAALRRKKFESRVKDVLEKSEGTLSVLRQTANVSISTTTSPTINQAIAGFSLYGMNGVSPTCNDVQAVFSSAITSKPGEKMTFHSGSIEFILATPATNNRTVVVDVYRVRPRQDIPQQMGTDPSGIWNNLLVLDNGGAVTATNYGITPFQSPQFCTFFNIETKESHILNPATSVKFDYRDHYKKFFIQGQSLDLENISFKRKWSTLFIIVLREIFNGGTSTVQQNLNIQVMRTYKVTNPQILSNGTIIV